jgi:Domain of unknown function (DUF397)
MTNRINRGPLTWAKASRCDSGACVEVALTEAAVGVRDSTDPDGPKLWFGSTSWAAFIQDIREGQVGPS